MSFGKLRVDLEASLESADLAGAVANSTKEAAEVELDLVARGVELQLFAVELLGFPRIASALRDEGEVEVGQSHIGFDGQRFVDEDLRPARITAVQCNDASRILGSRHLGGSRPIGFPRGAASASLSSIVVDQHLCELVVNLFVAGVESSETVAKAEDGLFVCPRQLDRSEPD